MKIEIRKCPECGCRVEKLYSGWVCVRCYHKITVQGVAEALGDRLAELQKVSEAMHPHQSKPMLALAQFIEVLERPFFWETEGEPEPFFDEDGSINKYDGEDCSAGVSSNG